MKKTLVAIAAVAATASSFAQVTLSGQVQFGYAKAVSGVSTFGTGAKGDRNYLSIAANEDIGGGLKAGALLQNRFNSSTGAQTQSYVNSSSGTTADMLWEQSMVYISDSNLGELKFGRFSTQLVTAGGAGHFMEDYGTGTHSGTAYGRDSGQVQYTAPKFGGIEAFVVQKSGKENKYATATNSSGLGIGLQTQQANANFIGFNYENGPIKTQFVTGSGFNKEKYNIVNAQYTVNGIDLAINQMNQKTDQYTYSGTLTSYAHTSTEIGAATYITPSFWLSVSTLVNNKNVIATTDTKRAVSGLHGKYNISKRTYLEGFYGSISQDVNFATGAVAAAPNGSAYFLGLAHSF